MYGNHDGKHLKLSFYVSLTPGRAILVIMSRDLRTVFIGVWLSLSLVAAMAAVAPFALGTETIAKISPVCESKRTAGGECWMCGSTSTFTMIARGDWSGAAESNRAAVALFVLFGVNGLIAAAFLVRRSFSSRKSGNADIMEPET
jgi:hypothetical protein